MKRKNVKNSIALLIICCALSSCYTYTSVVGKGPQSNQSVSHQNHYLIDGLIPVKTSDSKAMAGDATDYSVTVEHSVLDGLLAIITFGLYTPTTTTVTK